MSARMPTLGRPRRGLAPWGLRLSDGTPGPSEPSPSRPRREPETVERVALEVEPHESSVRYLRTKKERMGHLIEVA